MTSELESHANSPDHAGSRPDTQEFVRRLHDDPPRGRGGALLLFVVVLGVLGFGGWKLFGQSLWEGSGSGGGNAGQGVLTHTVAKERLLVTVVAAGNMESAKNIDVKCQVAGGAAILEIVADGQEVQEGDLLVKLDSSTIEDQLNAQKINLGKAMASKIQAEEDFEAAEIAVQEYAEGTFVKEMQIAEANINIAQENLRSSENLLDHTRKMSRKGFATSLQVEADQFAVERSKLELESAKTAKNVLEKFTRKKMLTELNAKKEAAAARKSSEQAAYDLERERYERLERQLKNTEIRARQNGMVIYANETGGGRGFSSGSSIKIELGATVRESQTILRLPDLSNMQCKMTVHESKVDRLKVGMPASVRIGDRILQGRISYIASQPEATSFFNANVKEYGTVVKIEGEQTNLKPGLTAEVEVLVADLPDVPTIPVSCVVEQGGKFFAWVVTPDNKYERRLLTVGMTNDKVFEVKDGVKAGDVVLLNPRAVVEEARKEESRSVGGDVDPRKKFGEGSKPDAAGDKANGSGDKAAAPEGDSKTAGGGQPKVGAARPPLTVAEIMKQDKDGDGKISQDEASEMLKRFWDRNDANADGFVDRDEAKAMVDRARQRAAGGGGPGGPGGGPPGGPGTP